jgi:hypothetical protein
LACIDASDMNFASFCLLVSTAFYCKNVLHITLPPSAKDGRDMHQMKPG